MSDGLFTVGGTDWFTLRSAALTSSTFGVTRTGDKLVAVSRRAG